MRICFVSFVYSNTSTGGRERYLDTTIKEIVKRGHQVHIITASYDKDKVETDGNLTIHNLRFMNPMYKDKEEGGRRLYKYLKRVVETEGIDIISAENFYRSTPPSYAFAINLVSLEQEVPAILRMHAHFEKEIEKALLKDLMWTKLIGVSKSVNNCAYNAGANIKKLALVYPGIDTSTFRPGLNRGWLRDRIGVSNSDILILHASRIIGSKRDFSYLEAKGVTTLLEAFAILSQKNKNLKLLIATALPPKIWQKSFDEEVKKIKDIAEINGVKNKVIVRPFELGEMPNVYNGSDIFVMASEMESFGLVYAEALACGIPAIGTSVGGITEIIDNNLDGFLVEPKKAVELAKRMDILVKDTNKRKSMGNEGLRKIKQKFELKKMVDRLIGVYSSCLEKEPQKEKKITSSLKGFLEEIKKE